MSLSLVLFSAARPAAAAGGWAASAPLVPVEQRVAVAAGPARTTIWTSLRFTQASSGKVAIVAPASAGAAIDLSSDAWFEALEVATAPRIFPPLGVDAACPGAPAGSSPLFDLVGHVDHVASVKVDDVAVLDDAPAVSAWAEQAGLALSPALLAALDAVGPSRFVALRFQAPEGPSVTPTLRISTPGAPPLLPLSLVRAGVDDLAVTAWTIGPGASELSGGHKVSLAAIDLRWDAAAKQSDYRDDREAALAVEGDRGVLLECASPEAIAESAPIAAGKASIDSLLATFFERASAYGDAAPDPSGCLLQAGSALASIAIIGSACPRASLGTIDGGPSCVEVAAPNQIDPAELRCGAYADDLAVALSDLSPSATWLSRQALQIPAGKGGADWFLTFDPAGSTSPVRFASKVDVSGCPGGSGSSSSGTVTFDDPGTTSSSGGSSTSGSYGSGSYGSGSYGDGSYGSGSVDGSINVDVSGCSCASTADTASSDGSGCDGSTDTTASSGCDGSSADGSESCSGDSADASGCDGSSASDASCDSGGGSSDMSCDGGGGGDMECAIVGASIRRVRVPKLSVLSMLAIAVAAPLRRRGRAARQAGKRAPKAREVG